MTIMPVPRGPLRPLVRDRRDASAGSAFAVTSDAEAAAGSATAVVAREVPVTPATLLSLQSGITGIERDDHHVVAVAEKALDALGRLQIALLDVDGLSIAALDDLSDAAAELDQIGGPAAELAGAFALRIRVELAKRSRTPEAGS